MLRLMKVGSGGLGLTLEPKQRIQNHGVGATGSPHTDKRIGGCGFDEHCAETTIVVHGRSGREHVVVKLFSGRIAKLETMNRILTDSARQRAQRVEELERKVEIMEPQLLDARKRLKVFEDAATERAARIQELESELRELRIERANRIQEFEDELRELRIEHAMKDFPRVEAEREFYRKRMIELEDHNRQLTEAATKYASQAQELEQELSDLRSERRNKKKPLPLS